MTDQQIIEQFERSQTPDGRFHHEDHVRVAFAYLRRYSLLETLERFSAALQRFAEAQGKAGLYHQTITWAYLFLIQERMARAGSEQSWEEFAQQNLDLLVWKGGAVQRCYRPETLSSELARTIFVLPDRIVGASECASATQVDSYSIHPGPGTHVPD